ncbi:LOW QUALITY PROTEIN: hypothetical protein U9M48_044473 [Paspalum notatum var. saurae]|uniref:Uncharacterized protein n=1 Tax=Paspalum notatum var. saurae TaxID=547442 RepID=A0AAQ3XGR3_PASNO
MVMVMLSTTLQSGLLHDVSSAAALLAAKPGCLGSGTEAVSVLANIISTWDIRGRSSGFSCTHRSPTLRHLSTSSELKEPSRFSSTKSRPFPSFSPKPPSPSLFSVEKPSVATAIPLLVDDRTSRDQLQLVDVVMYSCPSPITKLLNLWSSLDLNKLTRTTHNLVIIKTGPCAMATASPGPHAYADLDNVDSLVLIVESIVVNAALLCNHGAPKTCRFLPNSALVHRAIRFDTWARWVVCRRRLCTAAVLQHGDTGAGCRAGAWAGDAGTEYETDLPRYFVVQTNEGATYVRTEFGGGEPEVEILAVSGVHAEVVEAAGPHHAAAVAGLAGEVGAGVGGAGAVAEAPQPALVEAGVEVHDGARGVGHLGVRQQREAVGAVGAVERRGADAPVPAVPQRPGRRRPRREAAEAGAGRHRGGVAHAVGAAGGHGVALVLGRVPVEVPAAGGVEPRPPLQRPAAADDAARAVDGEARHDAGVADLEAVGGLAAVVDEAEAEAQRLVTVSGTPVNCTPSQGPERHTLVRPFQMNTSGSPDVSMAATTAPGDGSDGLAHAVSVMFFPAAKSTPRRIPGSSVSVGWSNPCHTTRPPWPCSDTTRFPSSWIRAVHGPPPPPPSAGDTDHTTVPLGAATASAQPPPLVADTESVAPALRPTAPRTGSARLATQTTVRTGTLAYQTPT